MRALNRLGSSLRSWDLCAGGRRSGQHLLRLAALFQAGRTAQSGWRALNCTWSLMERSRVPGVPGSPPAVLASAVARPCRGSPAPPAGYRQREGDGKPGRLAPRRRGSEPAVPLNSYPQAMRHGADPHRSAATRAGHLYLGSGRPIWNNDRDAAILIDPTASPSATPSGVAIGARPMASVRLSPWTTASTTRLGTNSSSRMSA
jgi:hypothetical protein